MEFFSSAALAFCLPILLRIEIDKERKVFSYFLQCQYQRACEFYKLSFLWLAINLHDSKIVFRGQVNFKNYFRYTNQKVRTNQAWFYCLFELFWNMLYHLAHQQ